MKSQKIRKTLKKHMRHMEQCASLWLYTDDGEAIHQLRVEYKKMRALIRLERLGTPAGRKITIPRNLKKLYKNAGEVRSLQIYYRSVVPFFENAHGYRADILQQIDVAKSKLIIKIRHFHFHKTLKSIEKHTPKRITDAMLKKFVEGKSQMMEDILLEKGSDEQIHLARKCLKDIIYAGQPFDEPIRRWLPMAGRKSEDELDKLVADLNNHQEYVVNLSLLNKSLLETGATEDRDVLRKIKLKWEDEKGAFEARL